MAWHGDQIRPMPDRMAILRARLRGLSLIDAASTETFQIEQMDSQIGYGTLEA